MILLLSRRYALLHECIASARRLVTPKSRLAPPSSPVLPSIPPRRSLHRDAHAPQCCVCVVPRGRNWSPGAGETPPQTGARLVPPAPALLPPRPDQPAP